MSQSSCKSCGALIEWVQTVRGAMMPINAQPDPTGNVIFSEKGAIVLGIAQIKAGYAEGMLLYRAHFSTCPNASRHRSKRT